MFSADFADFVYYAIDKFEIMPQYLNVGLGYDYSINEYYKKIADTVGYEGEFIHDLSRPSGMAQEMIDVKRLKSLVGNTPHRWRKDLKKLMRVYRRARFVSNYPLATSTWDDKELKTIKSVIERELYTIDDSVAQFW